jgi:hypothetical protein
MVIGHSGEHGDHVLLVVEVDISHVTEPVQIQSHSMVELIALDTV